MKDYYDFEEYERYYRSRKIDKERVILHSDLNNFFASVETLFSEELKNVPLAVCGDKEKRHGIVLAKNEEAKKYGIKTGETISSAMKKCPFLVIRPTHYSEYIVQSKKVIDIYLSYATRVEPFGIDEAWIDVTELAKRKKKCDVFQAGFSIAEEIRKRVKDETGLTVSIGVSFNKSFSKLASDFKKPDAVSVVSYDNFKGIVDGLPVENLLFVGRQTKEVFRRMKIETIGDLAKNKRITLKNALGKSGEKLWDTANGYDFSEVEFYHRKYDNKSVSKSTTTPYDIKNTEEANAVIYSLCEAISSELRKRKLFSSTVKLFVKYADFSSLVRQEKLTLPTSKTQDIYEVTSSLYKRNVDLSFPVRAIGVGAEELSKNKAEQMTLFFDKNSIDKTLDFTKEKYGKDIVKRASVIKNNRLCDFETERIAFNSGL